MFFRRAILAASYAAFSMEVHSEADGNRPEPAIHTLSPVRRLRLQLQSAPE